MVPAGSPDFTLPIFLLECANKLLKITLHKVHVNISFCFYIMINVQNMKYVQ